MDPYDFEDQTTVIKIKRRCIRSGKVQKAVCLIKTTSKQTIKISLDKVMERHMAYHRVLYPFLTKQQIKGLTLKYLGLPNSMGDIPRTPKKGPLSRKNAWCTSGLAVNSLAMFNYSKLLRQFVGKFQLSSISRQSSSFSETEKNVTCATDTTLAQSVSESEVHISEVSSNDEWEPVSKKQRVAEMERTSAASHTDDDESANDGNQFPDLHLLNSSATHHQVLSPKCLEDKEKGTKKATYGDHNTNLRKTLTPPKYLNKTDISKLITNDFLNSSSASDCEENKPELYVKLKKASPKKIEARNESSVKSKTRHLKNQELKTVCKHTLMPHKKIPLKKTKLEIINNQMCGPNAGKKAKKTEKVSKTGRLKKHKVITTPTHQNVAKSTEEIATPAKFSTPVKTTTLKELDGNQSLGSILFDSPIKFNWDSAELMPASPKEIARVRKVGEIDVCDADADFTIGLEIDSHETCKSLLISDADTFSSDSEDRCDEEDITQSKPAHEQDAEERDICAIVYQENGSENMQSVNSIEKLDYVCDIPEPVAEIKNKGDQACAQPAAAEVILNEKKNDVLSPREIDSADKEFDVSKKIKSSEERETSSHKKINKCKKKKSPQRIVEKHTNLHNVLQEVTENPSAKAKIKTNKKCSEGIKGVSISNEYPTKLSLDICKELKNLPSEEFENKVSEEMQDTAGGTNINDKISVNVKTKKRKVSVGVELLTNEKENNLNVEHNEDEIISCNENSPEIIPGSPISEDSIETHLKELKRKLDEASTPDTINSTESSTIQVSVTPRTAQIIENSDDEEEEGENEKDSSDDEMESLFSKKTTKSYSQKVRTSKSCCSEATADSLVFSRHKVYQKSRASRVPLNLPRINPATKVSRFLSGMGGNNNSQESYLSTSTDLDSSVEQFDQEGASKLGQRKPQYAASECSVRSILANLFDPIDDAGSRSASVAGTPTVNSVTSSPNLPAVMQPPTIKHHFRATRK